MSGSKKKKKNKIAQGYVNIFSRLTFSFISTFLPLKAKRILVNYYTRLRPLFKNFPTKSEVTSLIEKP